MSELSDWIKLNRGQFLTFFKPVLTIESKEWLVRESGLASSDSKQLIENMHDLIYCTSIPLTLKRIYRIYWKGFISDITGTRAPKGSSDAHAFYLVYLSSFKSNRNVVLQLSVVQSSPLITCSYMPFIKSSSIESWTAFAQRTLHVSFHMTHQVLFDASDLILRHTAFAHSDFLRAASACNALWEYSWAVAYMKQYYEKQQGNILNAWLVAFFYLFWEPVAISCLLPFYLD